MVGRRMSCTKALLFHDDIIWIDLGIQRYKDGCKTLYVVAIHNMNLDSPARLDDEIVLWNQTLIRSDLFGTRVPRLAQSSWDSTGGL